MFFFLTKSILHIPGEGLHLITSHYMPFHEFQNLFFNQKGIFLQRQPLGKMLLEIIINQVTLPGAFSDKIWPIEIHNNYYWCKFSHGIGQ